MRDKFLPAALAWLAFAIVGVQASDPVTVGIRELSPVPKNEPLPSTPIALDVGKYRWFEITGYKGAVTWEVDGESVGMKEVTKPLTFFGPVMGQSEPGEFDIPVGSAIVWGKSKGLTKLTAYGVVDGKAKRLFSKSFTVDGSAPKPPPDEPVEPVKPPVSLNPFTNQYGLHVLITFDGKETESQQSIIYGEEVRKYILEKCAIGPDGVTRAGRIWPVKTNASGAEKLWQDAFAKTGGKRRLLIGNGTKGYDGELPANVEETMKLLKSIGG